MMIYFLQRFYINENLYKERGRIVERRMKKKDTFDLGDVLEKDVHKRELLETYQKKMNELDSKFHEFHRELLKWMVKVRTWMLFKDLNKKTKGWIQYHMRMIQMEKVQFVRFFKMLNESIREEKSYKVRPLYNKLERIWRRIQFSKGKIDDAMEIKNIEELFEDIQMEEKEEDD